MQTSLDVLREAAQASPGNVFFATSWSGKGYPLVGMSGYEGVGLYPDDLACQHSLCAALEAIVELYNERKGADKDATMLANMWSARIFNGWQVRVMMYPPANLVAVDVDNVDAVVHLEDALGVRRGQLKALFKATPTLSRTGYKSLHGHHYLRLPSGINAADVARLTNYQTPVGKLGDVISVGRKYQVVYGEHASGGSYGMFSAYGQASGLRAMLAAVEIPGWLVVGLANLGASVLPTAPQARVGTRPRPTVEVERDGWTTDDGSYGELVLAVDLDVYV